MKKIALLVFIISLVFVSCNQSDDDSSDSNVKPQELLQNIPVSLDEFAASDILPARTVATVEVDKTLLEDVLRYEDIELSPTDIFMTVLKNDVSTTADFKLDELVTVENIEFSDVTKNLTAMVGMTPESIFSDLGKVKVSYSDNVVEIFWNCSIVNGDGAESTEPVNLYITGTYSDGKYDDLDLYIEYNFGNPQIQVEKTYKEGHKYNKKVTVFEYLDNDKYIASEKYEVIDGNTRITVSTGETGMDPESVEEASNLINNFKNISIVKPEFRADYIKQNFSVTDQSENYSVYNSTESFVFAQNFFNGKWQKAIPALYLNKPVYTDGNNYYLDVETTQSLILCEFTVLDTDNEENSNKDVQIPCYVFGEDTVDTINQVSDEEFSYKEISIEAVTQLISIKDNITDSDFIGTETVQGLEEKLTGWKNSLAAN